jgi:hypothetical protein
LYCTCRRPDPYNGLSVSALNSVPPGIQTHFLLIRSKAL